MLNQGIEILVIAPVNSDGLDPALDAAREQGVPVVTIDRKVTNESCTDYLTFLARTSSSRASAQPMHSRRSPTAPPTSPSCSARRATMSRTGARTASRTRSPPSTPTSRSSRQTANASRSEGQEVTAQLLQSNPEIDAIYAFNDEEGLGAMVAIQDAGLEPGADVKIVSIDGTRNAVQAIIDGTYNTVIESNPRFGPLVFETLAKFYDGEPITEDIIIKDGEYTVDDAEENVDTLSHLPSHPCCFSSTHSGGRADAAPLLLSGVPSLWRNGQ